jgi:DNA repair protein RadA/Sms
MVEGGVVLIGGDPGIGESTLLLQALDGLQRSGQNTLYVTGEESGAQVALRARRLGLDHSRVHVLAETQLGKIISTLQAQVAPHGCDRLDPNGVLRPTDQRAGVGSTGARMRRAPDPAWPRPAALPWCWSGHVTKEGALAGPRVLEHMVDTVLYFEGDTHSSFRLVRAIKNRFRRGQ